MNDEDLKRQRGVVFKDGNLWASEDNVAWRQVTGPNGRPEFRNLRNASLIMYHTLGSVQGWAELLITFLEAAECEAAVSAVLKMQAAVAVSRKIAVEGLENVANDRKET